MKLNEIRAFLAVARTGSILAASAQLNMTQSAVSRLIQRLELDLGATLFDRQTKPLMLTHDGHTAVDHGQRVLNAAEALSDAISPTAAPRGVLRIGTAHALAETVAERPLDVLRSSFPDLTLQISVGWAKSLIEELTGGTLDAAVVSLLSEVAPKTDLPALLLGKEEVRIVCGAPLSAMRWRSLGAMNEVGWVIQPEGCGYRTALASALEQAGAGPPRVVVEAFGKHLQLSVIARGAGFGLMPASQITAIPRKHKIKALDVPGFRFAVSTWFVRRLQLGRLARPLDAIEQALAGAIKK